MKKLLAILMAAAMLLSVCVVCVLPVAAAPESDGNPSASNDEFVISTHREDYFVEDDEDRLSRPGGVYTEDGFEVNPLGDEYADDYCVAELLEQVKGNAPSAYFCRVLDYLYYYDCEHVGHRVITSTLQFQQRT